MTASKTKSLPKKDSEHYQHMTFALGASLTITVLMTSAVAYSMSLNIQDFATAFILIICYGVTLLLTFICGVYSMIKKSNTTAIITFILLIILLFLFSVYCVTLLSVKYNIDFNVRPIYTSNITSFST